MLERTKNHWMVYFKIVKILNVMLCEFYLSKTSNDLIGNMFTLLIQLTKLLMIHSELSSWPPVSLCTTYLSCDQSTVLPKSTTFPSASFTVSTVWMSLPVLLPLGNDLLILQTSAEIYLLSYSFPNLNQLLAPPHASLTSLLQCRLHLPHSTTTSSQIGVWVLSSNVSTWH